MSEQKRTPELLETTLHRIAHGETLSSVARDLGFTLVSWSRWVRADSELSAAYYEARSIGADAIADDILNIVDNARVGAVDVAKARLRADTRLRLLAKWQPDKYGEKVDVRHQGHDGGAVQVAYANVGEIAAQMRAVLTGKAAPIELPEPPKAIAPRDGSDLL